MTTSVDTTYGSWPATTPPFITKYGVVSNLSTGKNSGQVTDPAGPPSSLFINNEVGVWYDPSDFSTMYQDSTGVTPVTAVEQPVGKILDKSGNGFHATQATSSSRPTLSARVNLLTGTGSMSTLTAPVTTTITNLTITDNVIANPLNGVVDASRITPTAGTLAHQFRLRAGGSVATYSFYLKADGIRYITCAWSSASRNAAFDLVAGTVIQPTVDVAGVSTITLLADGWCRIAFPRGSDDFVLVVTDSHTTGASGTVSTTNGTDGFYIWGAQLETGNVATTYQRVNTATDYDASSVYPRYLKFDGVDDSLATGCIDFSAGDKMTVFAGVRKINVITTQMIAELSIDLNSNNGSLNILASNATNRGYAFASRGTTVATPAFYAPTTPSTETAVISTTAAISENSATLRRNGVAATPSTDDQGTGNYGNYPLFVGRRGGTTLPFNGHIYSLVVRGAQSTDAQIASAEAYVAGKTGVVIP